MQWVLGAGVTREERPKIQPKKKKKEETNQQKTKNNHNRNQLPQRNQRRKQTKKPKPSKQKNPSQNQTNQKPVASQSSEFSPSRLRHQIRTPARSRAASGRLDLMLQSPGCGANPQPCLPQWEAEKEKENVPTCWPQPLSWASGDRA